MVAGARTFGIEETLLLDPPALPPPPMRHALFVFLIALAALLHVATIGWGDLYGQTEGQYAGAAREMLQSHDWLLPTIDGVPRLRKPPMLYWLIIASFKTFGVNGAAARLPIALAVTATVALTFLIGERLTDYWRGFLAGLIYLCSCGTFLLGRIIMPEPVFSAFIAGAIFCALCGYQHRRHRREWFLGFWICCALACLTKRRARSHLSGGGDVAARSFLSGSANPISDADPLELHRGLSVDRNALVHLGGIAFPRIFESTYRDRMVQSHLRQSDCSGRRCRRAAITISRPASRVVVSVVDRNSSRNSFCLAQSDAAARNRICRCFAALLDGRGFSAAAAPRTTPGLLFDEHVERVRALGCVGLATDAAPAANCRNQRTGDDRNIRGRVYAAFPTLVAGGGKGLEHRCDQLDNVARGAAPPELSLVDAAPDVRDHQRLAHHFLPDRDLSSSRRAGRDWPPPPSRRA